MKSAKKKKVQGLDVELIRNGLSSFEFRVKTDKCLASGLSVIHHAPLRRQEKSLHRKTSISRKADITTEQKQNQQDDLNGSIEAWIPRLA